MFPQLGMMEMIVVMGVAVLLFGKRLPEVGRSLGKGIIEFKKGLRGIEDEFDLSSTHVARPRPVAPTSEHRSIRRRRLAETSVPKFEPPTSAPVPADGVRAAADAGLTPAAADGGPMAERCSGHSTSVIVLRSPVIAHVGCALASSRRARRTAWRARAASSRRRSASVSESSGGTGRGRPVSSSAT